MSDLEAVGRGNSAHRSPRSRAEWAVLDALRAHLYDTRTRGDKPDDPGWHPCSCGWQGYWTDWQPHVAERVMEGLAPWLIPTTQ